jgi:hypothetical protein
VSECIYIFPAGKNKYLCNSHKFSVQVVFAFSAIYTRNRYGALPILFEYKVFTAVNLSVRKWNSRTQFPKNAATEMCWLYHGHLWPLHSNNVNLVHRRMKEVSPVTSDGAYNDNDLSLSGDCRTRRCLEN